jgi:hypothetical protein
MNGHLPLFVRRAARSAAERGRNNNTRAETADRLLQIPQPLKAIARRSRQEKETWTRASKKSPHRRRRQFNPVGPEIGAQQPFCQKLGHSDHACVHIVKPSEAARVCGKHLDLDVAQNSSSAPIHVVKDRVGKIRLHTNAIIFYVEHRLKVHFQIVTSDPKVFQRADDAHT